MKLTRRRVMIATGAALGLAGCARNSTERSGDDPTGTDSGDWSGGDDVIEHEVFQLGPSSATPLWATAGDTTGFVTLLDDKYDDPWMVRNPDERDGLLPWLQETDFDQSAILYVETAGPDTCYDELAIHDLAIDNGGITGTAEAVDTGNPDDRCGDAETYPAAFVRVTEADSPTEATITVIDGWGDSRAVTTNGVYVMPADLPGHVRPGGDPPMLQELTCGENSFQRLESPAADEVALGEVYDDEDLTFAMRVQVSDGDGDGTKDIPQAERGDTARITMWNVSTDTQLTGIRDKWNLQILTLDGWQDVRGTTTGDLLGHEDLGIEHRPGEAFEWTLKMTEKGIVDGHEHEDALTVCPDLQAGRYRFVYRGIVSSSSLAVEFHYSG